jgi:hypothetical protein
MKLVNPVTAYVASTNLEAQLLKVLLQEAAVEAHVSEDNSLAGLWAFGTLPEVHRPRIWVSETDLNRAQVLLNDYEARAAEREEARGQTADPQGATIEVLCEECNQKFTFTAAKKGTIQDCPHCGAYADVGDPIEDAE